MALDALTIATQGLLSTAELIAVQGLLDSDGPLPPTPGFSGGWSVGAGAGKGHYPPDYGRVYSERRRRAEEMAQHEARQAARRRLALMLLMME